VNIYVASSWRNAYQQNVVAQLRAQGHAVYDFRNPKPGEDGFHWSEIDPTWRTWTPEAYRRCLCHPIATAGFNSDYAAMEWADMCVLVLPSGRSAHLEAGWFMGRKKPVIVFVPEAVEPELMYLLAGPTPLCTMACTATELRLLVEAIATYPAIARLGRGGTP
jgi:hypothetical protein